MIRCGKSIVLQRKKFVRNTKENPRKNQYNSICIVTANATTWQRHACIYENNKIVLGFCPIFRLPFDASGLCHVSSEQSGCERMIGTRDVTGRVKLKKRIKRNESAICMQA